MKRLIQLLGGMPIFILYVGSAVAMLTARVAGFDHIAAYLIPICVFGYFLYSLPNAKGSFHLLSIALFFAFLGDVAANWSPIPWILALPFAVTQICLVIFSWWHSPRWHISQLLWLIPGTSFSLICAVQFWPHIDNPLYPYIIVIYFTLLNLMLWRTLLAVLVLRHDSTRYLWLIGSLLFFGTDHLVVATFFFTNSALTWGIWLGYPTALFLLACLHRLSFETVHSSNQHQSIDYSRR